MYLLSRGRVATILLAVAVLAAGGTGKQTSEEAEAIQADHSTRHPASAGGGREGSRPQRLPGRSRGEGGRDLASASAERGDGESGNVDGDFPSPLVEVDSSHGGADDGDEVADVGAHGARAFQGEAYSIRARDIPFLQKPGDWQRQGHGISMSAKGEPKSGTTWLGRLMPQLALELCGSPTNAWCEMGGLVVYPNEPSPWYEFEMLTKNESGDHPSLFLHYKGNDKHLIPGMSWKNPPAGCKNGGRRHRNFFEDDLPCESGPAASREELRGCLWDVSARCLGFVPGDFRRTAVMFRDPRDVILSERRMRLDFYHQGWVKEISLDEFVRQRFENVVSWTHQRWVWHVETPMQAASHVMFYEKLQADHLGMIDLAAFMGLGCSAEQALSVWESHQNAAPHGDYTTHGLQTDTIEWMNATMARLLPPATLEQWGLTPIGV